MDNKDLKVQEASIINKEGLEIKVIRDGPYKVLSKGPVVINQKIIFKNEGGKAEDYRDGKTFEAEKEIYLCRCGHSKDKPFCDGAHEEAVESGLNLSTHASHEPSLEESSKFEGPVLNLYDNKKLCSRLGFCNNHRDVWTEVKDEDPKAVEKARDMTHKCVSGRLVLENSETREIEEREFEQVEIGIIEDEPKKASGPIYIVGGIPVQDEEGNYYEVRNRQSLCRCGRSLNKPYCDGSHLAFKDGLLED